MQGLQYADEVQELDDFPLRNGLSYKARKEAEFLYSIARGVMLVTGEPGSGKDLFGVGLCAMNKYFFGDIVDQSKPRKILLDFLPRKAFGEYHLFNAEVMMDEINKMAKAARVEGIQNSADKKEMSEFIKDSATKWATEGEGETLLKGAILYLSELKRYCYNRNPHNPFNKFIGSLCTVWRHLDLLILGTHVQWREIDRYSFLYYVTHHANCDWSMTRPDTTDVTILRRKFIGNNKVFNVTNKPMIMHVCGSEPRSFLDGSSFYDLYHTKNMMDLKPVMSNKKADKGDN